MATESDGVVLDASAILALLHGESGADQVAVRLDAGTLSSVNLSEVVGRLAVRGWTRAEIDKVFTLPCRVVEFDARMARATGELQASTRNLGLSLGDRACLATALSLGIRHVLTADRAWLKLAIKPLRIELIR